MNDISKYSKIIIIVLLFLFSFKFIQSCNRKSTIRINESSYNFKLDSLNNINKYYIDSIRFLNYKLELEKNKTLSANEKALAIQNAVEKLKQNTTVVVKGMDKN